MGITGKAVGSMSYNNIELFSGSIAFDVFYSVISSVAQLFRLAVALYAYSAIITPELVYADLLEMQH